MASGCTSNPTCGRDREEPGEHGVERYLPDLDVVWSLTQGDRTVCIAVLDGTVDASHPCFEGAVLKQLSLLSSADRARGQGLHHGTYTASLIFGQHHSAVRGVAPRCRGVLIPVFREREDGSIVPCSQLDLARAISLAVAVGANVINISAGRLDDTGEPEPQLARAIRLCADHGILIVASAGNDGCACLHVPASAPTVLAVGAMDATGQPLEFSNWAESYASHGVLAPGDMVAGAEPGGGVAVAGGTSVATAVVSGVAGLLMSLQVRSDGKVDVQAVRTAILAGSVGCDERPVADCRRLLAGRLDVVRAVSLLSKGECAAMSNAELPAVPRSCEGAADRRERNAQGATGASDENRDQRTRFNDGKARLVYALGRVAYDFGSDARRDAFFQRGVDPPEDAGKLLDYLADKPWESTGLTWTLRQDQVDIYALQPTGPFAAETHKQIHQLLRDQVAEKAVIVSIPGLLAGMTTLSKGHETAVVQPEIRGMCSWSVDELLKSVAKPEEPDPEKLKEEIKNFLQRLYYELRNLGAAPQERAVNYVASNVHQVTKVCQYALQEHLKLDRIAVERSALGRPGSECWDVVTTLFDPARRFERGKEVFRLTVDVSEVLPVTIGDMQHWSVY